MKHELTISKSRGARSNAYDGREQQGDRSRPTPLEGGAVVAAEGEVSLTHMLGFGHGSDAGESDDEDKPHHDRDAEDYFNRTYAHSSQNTPQSVSSAHKGDFSSSAADSFA